MNWLVRSILRVREERPADFVIGGKERPYLLRWWLLPRNRLFNVYLHEFRRKDDDRALHDHPWAFNASWVLRGAYTERLANGSRLLEAGDFRFRWGKAPHRVELLVSQELELPCWTLFFTGPVVRNWGFYCPRGWVPWQEFTNPADKGDIGRGCG